MSNSPTRRVLVMAGASTMAAALALTVPMPAQAATPTYTAFSGSAYVSYVAIGTTITSGRSALSSLCTTKTGLASTNSVARLTVPLIGTVGAANTKVASSEVDDTDATTTTTSTAATSLLGGLVQASAITSSARVSRTGDVYTNTGTSTFVGLRIAGKAVTVRPTEKSTITIPGIATVLLNAQSVTSSGGTHTLGVTAIRVTLLKGNTLGLPTGTILVGTANAGVRDLIYRRPVASAYGTEADVAGRLASGPTAAVSLPCGGTDITKTSKLAGFSLPGVVEVGTLDTRVSSTDNAASTTANASAETGDISLLGGVVSVDAVTADASSTRVGSKVTSTSAGTRIVGLRINGVTQTTADVEENTTIDIAGVGTLYLRRAVRTSSSLQVSALQLQLSTAQLGLAAGTTLTVGSAHTAVGAS